VSVDIHIPEKLLGLWEPKRFKVAHGGRGSGKSHSIAQVLLAKGLQAPKRILCVREIQKSLKWRETREGSVESPKLGNNWRPKPTILPNPA